MLRDPNRFERVFMIDLSRRFQTAAALGVAWRALLSPASAQLSEADLVVRIERLENQIRQLTGTDEQLQYRNQQLEEQLRRGQQAEIRPPPGPPPGARAAAGCRGCSARNGGSAPGGGASGRGGAARAGTPRRRLRSLAESQ